MMTTNEITELIARLRSQHSDLRQGAYYSPGEDPTWDATTDAIAALEAFVDERAEKARYVEIQHSDGDLIQRVTALSDLECVDLRSRGYVVNEVHVDDAPFDWLLGWEQRMHGPDDINIPDGEIWTCVGGRHQWRRRPDGSWDHREVTP